MEMKGKKRRVSGARRESKKIELREGWKVEKAEEVYRG